MPATTRANRRRPPFEPEPFGLYIHVPFCALKCPYCDFNTYAGLEHLFEAYVEALLTELDRWAGRIAERTVTSIFLGGGTPTVLPLSALARILARVRDRLDVAPGCEITSEANPGTVDRAKFDGLRALGVTRLSLGVQSLQAGELAFLGRIHGVADVGAAYHAARAAGFDNINLDLIFGLPGQSAQAWDATLDAALELAPAHLSLYSLIVEPNTPLYTWVETGRVAAPDDDHAAELYERARSRLASAGYTQYEVSNFARGPSGSGASPALACRHNLLYWRNQSYLGVGPGAHSHLREAGADRRWANVRPVPGYIARLRSGEPVTAFEETLDLPTAMGETMLLGLRLTREGVSIARFHALHGRDPRAVYAAELDELCRFGLVDVGDDAIRLTERGLMVGNRVFERFVAG